MHAGPTPADPTEASPLPRSRGRSPQVRRLMKRRVGATHPLGVFLTGTSSARGTRRYASPQMLASVTALYRPLLQFAALSWSMNLVISSIRFAKAPPSFIAAAKVSCEP
jgi:hypothetical protein